MPSSRKAACSAVNFAGSAPRHRISRESSVMMNYRGTVQALSLDGQRNSIAAAQAQRRNSSMYVPPLHFVKQRRQNPRTRGADGMSDRNRAAVYIHFCWIEAQLARHGDCCHGKSFV